MNIDKLLKDKQSNVPLVDAILDGNDRPKRGFWDVVDELVKFLMHKHPDDMKAILLQAKFEREYSHNQFSENTTKTGRALGYIPENLILALDRIYGDNMPISQQKFNREFFRRYPAFGTAEKI